MSDSATRLLSPWDFPGKSTEVDCHFLLQRIFPTLASNPGLLHCRQTLYCLSYHDYLRNKGPNLHKHWELKRANIPTWSSFLNLTRTVQETKSTRKSHSQADMLNHKFKSNKPGLARWLRICLPMQRMRVRSLTQEDSTCHRATKPVHQNYGSLCSATGEAIAVSPHMAIGDQPLLETAQPKINK